MRKHRNEFGSDPVQLVLGTENLGMLLLEPFRKRVEAVSNMIVRRVKVDRSRTPQKALDATNRRQYTTQSVVDTMPRGKGEETEVFFFKLGRWAKPAEVQKEYDLRGLKPDPVAQTAVNENDPAFADEHPNGGQWQDADGNWCYAAFNCWDGERDVLVRRDDDEWRGNWWFAGVPAS